MDKPQPASVQTIGRVSQVLRALAEGPADGMRLSAVAGAAGLGKTTALRLLKALAEVGYAEFDDDARLYRLGYGLFLLGQSARRFHIIDLARAGLDRLAATTGDTVFLSVRDGDVAHCIDRRTGSYPIRTLTLSVGDRRPLGVGAGSLALLAFESDAEIDRVLAANAAERRAYPGFTDAALRAMIVAARQSGHAFNDGRIVTAMNAVGVPVLDEAGRVAAALSVAAIRERMAPDRLAGIVGRLKQEASELGGLLDGRRRAAARPANRRVEEKL
ncbi:MAG: IclR family transcriptional regulator [Jhaorihella sp.]